MDVLDVACGTGNATIPAAQAGARVTGLDFSPELLEIARERGSDAMVEVEWIEGDAQELPFEDAQLRPRDLDLRAHVRAGPQTDGRRDAPRLPPGGHDRSRMLDAGGRDRADVPHGRRAGAATARHARRSSGEPRSTSASCSAKAEFEPPRDRVGGRVGRVLRAVHARELRPTAERAGGARRAGARAGRGLQRRSSLARTRTTTARCASPASTWWGS